MLGNLLKKYTGTVMELLPEVEQVDINLYTAQNDFEFDDIELDILNDEPPNTHAEARRQRVLDMLSADPSITRALIDDHESDPLNVIFTLAIRSIGTVELLLPKNSYDGTAILNSIESLQTDH